MPRINFSHGYLKHKHIDVHEPAQLLQIFRVIRGQLSKPFIEYDTAYLIQERDSPRLAYYPLPKHEKAPLLVLMFNQDFKIFTTVRPDAPGYYDYYQARLGQGFDIQINDKESGGSRAQDGGPSNDPSVHRPASPSMGRGEVVGPHGPRLITAAELLGLKKED